MSFDAISFILGLGCSVRALSEEIYGMPYGVVDGTQPKKAVRTGGDRPEHRLSPALAALAAVSAIAFAS
mgnify:CR=1 FL=1